LGWRAMATIDARLRTRVAALEASHSAALPDSQTKALTAAVGALLEAAESGAGPANKGQHGRDFLLALQARLDIDTATDTDLAMLDALPVCHLPPRTLVWALSELLAGNERRD